MAYAYICTDFVSLYERTGRSIKTFPNAREALTVRESKTKDENDLVNGFSDVGYSSIAVYQAGEGLKCLEKALAIAEAIGEPERYKVFNIDRFLRNHGRGNMLLGRLLRGNGGESARVQWRMSQIMEIQGLVEEANTYREAGGKTKKELAASGDYPKGITEDDTWDVFIGLLYR